MGPHAVKKPGPGHIHGSQIVIGFTIFHKENTVSHPTCSQRWIRVNILSSAEKLRAEDRNGGKRGREGGNKEKRH